MGKDFQYVINKTMMAQVKKIPGVTYVSFMTIGSEEFVRVKKKNDLNGVDTIDFRLVDGATRNTMTVNDWEYLVHNIKNFSYDLKESI